MRAEFARSLSRVSGQLGEGTSVVLVAKWADGIVGVVELSPADIAGRAGDGGAPMLGWLTVDRAHRRAGIGRGLLVEALAIAARAGSSHVHSSFSAANLTSLYWHMANGFRVLPDSATAGTGTDAR